MHLSTGNELCRRSRNYFNYDTGNGLCSGTMYWQFNDLWQAPTWASIEYGGKWKLAHYFVKRSYSKLHLSAIFNSSKIDIYALSDHKEQVKSQFDANVYSYDSMSPKFSRNYKFAINAFSSESVVSIDLDEIQKVSGCSFNDSNSCVLVLTSNDELFEHGDFINFLLFKNRLADVKNLHAPNLSVQNVRKLDAGVFEINLKTDQISLFVALDMNTTNFKGVFSDNGFHMVGEHKVVTFKTNNLQVTEKEVEAYLTIHSLMNTYGGSKANKIVQKIVKLIDKIKTLIQKSNFLSKLF